MGMMGHTQGVNRAMRPPAKPMRKMYHQAFPATLWSSLPKAAISSTTGAHHEAVRLPSAAPVSAAAVVAAVAVLSVGAAVLSAAVDATAADVASFGAASSAGLSAFGPSEPLTLHSTAVGGRQFWSLQALYSR